MAIFDKKSNENSKFVVSSQKTKIFDIRNCINQIIEIMKTSIRGKRNIMEKDALRKFIVNHMTCIPSKELRCFVCA